MQIGFGQISPSALSSRDLGTRLVQPQNRAGRKETSGTGLKSSIVKITMKQEFSPYFLKIKVQKKLPASRIGGEISLDTNYSLGRNHRLNVGHF